MSSKKLQTEVERTLKKVSEGLEIFHETLDKLNSATTPNQKEKYEVDLKKEIKKLQRLRDTIKGWQTSSEIKDKQPINEARKSIEVQMEKFKILEKEMKIKAFSKEGLNQAIKLDPKAREKLELSHWINGVVDKLNTQIDLYEAEVESIVLNMKKGKKLEPTKQSRNDLLMNAIVKHKVHIQKLEAVLRMMENDQVSPDQIASIREEVDYYVESHLEDDFMENEALYDDFDFTNAPESRSDSDSEYSDRDEIVFRKKIVDVVDQAEKPIVLPSVKPVAVVTIPSRNVTVTSSANSSNAPVGRDPMESYVKVVSPPPTLPAAPGPKIAGPSFASALAAANSTAGQTVSPHAPRSDSLSRGSISGTLATKLFGELDFYLSKRTSSDLLKQNATAYLNSSYFHLPENYELERQRHYSPKHPYAMPSYYQSDLPQILNNPSIFERFDLDTLFFIFYYQQKTYPQYSNASYLSSHLFRYLAARELKKQSWRFHKKYLTWFQRHEEPKAITNDYEQGTYIYFDYEGSWCQRKKSEFTFEYRYLEDEELV